MESGSVRAALFFMGTMRKRGKCCLCAGMGCWHIDGGTHILNNLHTHPHADYARCLQSPPAMALMAVIRPMAVVKNKKAGPSIQKGRSLDF